MDPPLPLGLALGAGVGTVLGRMPLTGMESDGEVLPLDAPVEDGVESGGGVEDEDDEDDAVDDAGDGVTPEGRIPDGMGSDEPEEREWKLGIGRETRLLLLLRGVRLSPWLDVAKRWL